MMTTTRQFENEAKATAYWNSIGRLFNGRRVVSNELEYKKDGSFEVVTVTEAA